MDPSALGPDGLPIPYASLSQPPRRRWWLWGGVGCLALVGFLIVGFGAYLEWAWIAEPATPGPQVPSRVIRKIRALGLLQAGEEVQYLYSDGSFRMEEDLSFFTQRRLVLHCEEWEQPTIAVDLADIEGITPTFADSMLDYSYLDVTCKDGTELTVTLDNARGGDRKYYHALKRAWEAARGGR